MIKFLSATFLICFYLSNSYTALAQDVSDDSYMDKRNAIKMSFYFTRNALSYEHAFSRHVSLGVMGTIHGGTFDGYIGSGFARFYAGGFNKHGFFMEGKFIYGYFNPVVYSSYTVDQYSNYSYTGEHRADITYTGGSFSVGYKVFITPAFFCEFMTGFRGGVATLGPGDLYFKRGDKGGLFYTQHTVEHLFYSRGPGSAIDLLINFGISF